MHGVVHGVGLRQGQFQPEFDLEARIERWEAKARERRELIGVPSNHIHDPKAMEIEQQFKSSAARYALALVKPGMRVLDIGCGSAQFAKYFIPELLSQGGSYVGIDQCQWTVDFAWQHLEKNGIRIDGKSVMLTQGLATRLTWGRKRPFSKEFDLIIDGQNMIHVVDDEEFKFIAEQHCEVLKLGGHVFWYGPCCDLNFRYQGEGAMKNQDTRIRYEKEITSVFSPHHIILKEGTRPLHAPYFSDEIYSFIAMQQVRPCYENSAE